METILPILGPVLGLVFVSIFALTFVKWILSLRRVVATNEVHIVQSSKRTISYGKDTADKRGNVYYEWPHWIPVIGVRKVVLSTAVFDLDLTGYEAYDKGRLPFVVDIKAFFRIANSNLAAARVDSFQELQSQLTGIVQGAVRTIMANAELEAIMSQRSTYGEQFTKEVAEQLESWGVIAVKNIELMDIRDNKDSHVISNIMAKKKSHIEMESRTEVALNMQKAQQAEIDAQREIDLQKQQAEQTVGLRKAQVVQEVGIANEKAQQEVKEQQRMTKEKEMAVLQVQTVRQAQITKDAQVVQAEQEKETTVLIAEGQLEAKTREAKGIQVEGEAKAAAEKALQMAPVTAQLELAAGIGANLDYQNYMVRQREVEAKEKIGVAQAQALANAEVKVIANSGSPASGIEKITDMFSSDGGTKIAALLEGLNMGEVGAGVVEKFLTPKKAA